MSLDDEVEKMRRRDVELRETRRSGDDDLVDVIERALCSHHGAPTVVERAMLADLRRTGVVVMPPDELDKRRREATSSGSATRSAAIDPGDDDPAIDTGDDDPASVDASRFLNGAARSEGAYLHATYDELDAMRRRRRGGL
jgi:hypothetical protein